MGGSDLVLMVDAVLRVIDSMCRASIYPLWGIENRVGHGILSKHISLLILKISFLTLYGCGVKIHQTNPIFGYRVKITPRN